MVHIAAGRLQRNGGHVPPQFMQVILVIRVNLQSESPVVVKFRD
jgi:hypothetical protein